MPSVFIGLGQVRAVFMSVHRSQPVSNGKASLSYGEVLVVPPHFCRAASILFLVYTTQILVKRLTREGGVNCNLWKPSSDFKCVHLTCQ
jgi:hypothetical protein